MKKSEKTVLITGGAGIMGTAVAKVMSRQGYRIILADINEAVLKDRAAGIEGRVYPAVCDISSSESIKEMIASIPDEFKPVQILVNNAGILSNNKSEQTSDEEWNRVMKINLSGPFFIARELLPVMKENRWGRIVNVSSLAAKSGGITAGTAYTVSKGGIISLTFSLAAELAEFGITVNAVAPAYVKTPMVTEQLNESQRRALLDKIPVGRFCEPEEFAELVAFLCGEQAGFITGEVIDINGGLLFD